jgi:hypothetical protein
MRPELIKERLRKQAELRKAQREAETLARERTREKLGPTGREVWPQPLSPGHAVVPYRSWTIYSRTAAHSSCTPGWTRCRTLPGWDILVGNPFGSSHCPKITSRRFRTTLPSTIWSIFGSGSTGTSRAACTPLLLFATRVDAETFRAKHPARVFGKTLTSARSKGAYICSFHDSSWLDYLRLPHNLSLSTLDTIANHYWKGALVEERA